MTRKHFRALAEALHDTNASQETCRAIADICYADNHNFSRERFMTACGV